MVGVVKQQLNNYCCLEIYYDKIKDNKTRLVTSGHKTLGVSWLVERSTSHQSSLSVGTFAVPKSPTFHTANCYCKVEKKERKNQKLTKTKPIKEHDSLDEYFVLPARFCLSGQFGKPPHIAQICKSLQSE
jgi:hypothetical protein